MLLTIADEKISSNPSLIAPQNVRFNNSNRVKETIHVPSEMNDTEIPLSLANMYGAQNRRKVTTKLDGALLGMQDLIQM